jgi:phosphoribosylaminoimidazole-succinocarboxamide synthase
MDTFTDRTLDGLKLLSRGKVRDVYETSDPNALLFVASDRISAYDVILNNVCTNFGMVQLFSISEILSDRRQLCREYREKESS